MPLPRQRAPPNGAEPSNESSSNPITDRHLRVAGATAFLALPEGQRGIDVGGGASMYAARLMGASRTADVLLTGRVLDAAAAGRAGLVNHLEPAGGAPARAATEEAADQRRSQADTPTWAAS